jgi:hypothetical protein
VVLPAIAAELVIRGVVLPSLARSVGLVPGVAVATLLTPAPFALLCGGEVPQPVVGAALLGGAGLSLAYLKTGSAYPGIAALATGLGLAYGLSLGWSAAAAGVLGLAAAAAALVLTGWLAAAWSTSLRRSHYGAPARAWG